MKKYWIEYSKAWTPSPASYWVHKEMDGKPWYQSEEFDPPKPGPVPGRGYARVFVEYEGLILEFSSRDEISHYIDVLSKKNLPSTIQLSRQRATIKGPNSHWLSRLPAKSKSWKFREGLVEYLAEVLGLLSQAS